MLDGAAFRALSVEAKPTKRNPAPPFTTSTLQQAASSRLGFGATRTMQVAQRLYEGIDVGGETVGLITYMRTDGVQMAPEAIAAAREAIVREFGEKYLPEKPRYYSTKAKNAQEAHEAIRPTDFSRTPASVRGNLDADQARLYEMIWKRAIASQMNPAEIERTTVEIEAVNGTRAAGLRATGSGRPLRRLHRRLHRAEGGRRRGRGGAPPARNPAGRAAGPRGDQRHPAHHRTAAALYRGDADQQAGGARHRPTFHLCGDPEDAGGPRLCRDRSSPPDPARQGAAGDGVPGKLLRTLCRIRLHRLSRRKARRYLGRQAVVEGCAARLLDRFLRFGGGHQGAAGRRCARRAQRGAGAASVPAPRRRRRPAHLPALRHRQAVAEARQVRRLRRLLQLSRMRLYPPARRIGDGGRCQRRQRGRSFARHRPLHERGDHAEIRPLRPLCPARRGQGGQARQPAQGLGARGDRPREGAGAAVAAARRGQAPGNRQDDHRRHRPLRSVRPARRHLCQSRDAGGGVLRRPQPCGRPDRREEADASAKAVAPHPPRSSNSASIRTAARSQFAPAATGPM